MAALFYAGGYLAQFIYNYDYLRATFDILRDENTSLLGIIKDIEKAYDEMEADNFREWADSTRHFDQMLAALPDRAWLE